MKGINFLVRAEIEIIFMCRPFAPIGTWRAGPYWGLRALCAAMRAMERERV